MASFLPVTAFYFIPLEYDVVTVELVYYRSSRIRLEQFWVVFSAIRKRTAGKGAGHVMCIMVTTSAMYNGRSEKMIINDRFLGKILRRLLITYYWDRFLAGR